MAADHTGAHPGSHLAREATRAEPRANRFVAKPRPCGEARSLIDPAWRVRGERYAHEWTSLSCEYR